METQDKTCGWKFQINFASYLFWFILSISIKWCSKIRNLTSNYCFMSTHRSRYILLCSHFIRKIQISMSNQTFLREFRRVKEWVIYAFLPFDRTNVYSNFANSGSIKLIIRLERQARSHRKCCQANYWNRIWIERTFDRRTF